MASKKETYKASGGSTSVKDLRAMFGGGSTPTPMNHHTRQKMQEEKARNAVKIAKARAARYNMTLRALALKQSSQAKKLQEADRAKFLAARKEAAKYNATKRAIGVGTAQPTRKSEIDDLNLGKAMTGELSPQLAQEALEVVAISQMTPEEIVAEAQKEAEERDRKEAEEEAAKETAAKEQAKEEAAREQAAKEEEEKEAEKTVVVEEDDDEDSMVIVDEKGEDVAFEMTNIEAALEEGTGSAINKAILVDFLETHAPEEIANVDAKLKEYEGREQLLFDYYTENYPGPEEGKLKGLTKAEEEIFEKKDEVSYAKKDEEEDDDVQSGYESVIAAVEEDPKQLEEAAKRHERRSRNDKAMEEQLDKYSKQAKSGTLTPEDLGKLSYITSAKMKQGEDGGPDWAVTTAKKVGSQLKNGGMDRGVVKKVEEAAKTDFSPMF